MLRKPPQFNAKDGTPFEIIINDFKRGTLTLLDESRIPQNGVLQSQNMMLDQDGVWRVRPGSQAYGKTLTGPIDGMGEAVVYNTDATNTNYLFALDNGTLKFSKDGGSWTSIAGKTWIAGNAAKIKQVYSRLYVINGKDNLAFVDLTTMLTTPTIVSYSPLSTPVAPTFSAYNTLTTGTYKVFYKYTAVNKNTGETAASVELSVLVNKQRSNWLNNATTQESMDLTLTRVTSADTYNVYYSDQSGQEVFIDSISDPGTGTTFLFRDTGQQIPNPFQAAPPTDGTAGVIATDICLSGNRVWFTGDPNNAYRVYWTAASPQNIGSLNPFYGGGYVDLNLGGDEKSVAIVPFRDGKGNSTAVALTSSPTGGGTGWFIALSTLTAGNVTVTVPAVTSQGTIGTNSSRGVVSAGNNIYYPSTKGFQSLGSAPNILNVLVTSEISTGIRPSVKSINNAYSSLICGVYYYGRIYFSVPIGSTSNNQVWVLDLERQAWGIYWNIGVKQFLEYTSSDGVIHLLGIPVTGTSLIEFSDSVLGDNGSYFSTNLQSGLIFWDKSHFKFAWVNKVYFELGRPKGNVSLNVSGTAVNKNLTSLKSISITDTISNSGLGSDLLGDPELGDSLNTPTTFSQSSVKKVLYINKPLNNLEWQITSNDINAQYTLLEVGIEGNMLPSGDPSSWRK